MPRRDGAALVVCRVEELPPGTHRVVRSQSGRSIAVYNVRGTFHAIANICPHQGGPLGLAPATGTTRARADSDGQFVPEWVHEGEIVRCGWHLYEFELESGRALADPKMRVATYNVRVLRDEESDLEGRALIAVEV